MRGMDVALRSTGYLLSLQSRAVLMPLSLLRLWLTAWASLLVTLLALLGLMPNEYANRVKVTLPVARINAVIWLLIWQFEIAGS